VKAENQNLKLNVLYMFELASKSGGQNQGKIYWGQGRNEG